MLLEKVFWKRPGLLDEVFFMYGEDIDFHTGLNRPGYRNVYFPLTTIIHYKGESTKKGSINYVVMFYNAMIIFAQQTFYPEYSPLLRTVYTHCNLFPGWLSIFQRFFMGIINPLLDALDHLCRISGPLPVWEMQLFGQARSLSTSIFACCCSALYPYLDLGSFPITGYEKSVKFTDLIKGLILGIVMSSCLLMLYCLNHSGSHVH